MVIEHLSTLYQFSADTGITFIYCNYKEPQTTIAYLRLALKQLGQTMQSLPPELQDVHRRHSPRKHRPKRLMESQPTYGELRIAFLAIIRQLGRVFFVLDALDECSVDQRKDLCDFILSVANTTSIGTCQGIVKLFITSRKELDIEQAFQQEFVSTIEIAAAKVNSDIEAYVKAQIELRLQNRSLRLRNMELKDKISSILTTKACGRYVFFYIKTK